MGTQVVMTDEKRQPTVLIQNAQVHEGGVLVALPESCDASLASYRRAVARWATRHSWGRKPIELWALPDATAVPVGAREALATWLSSEEPQHCVLLGDPGSGKSGLVSWMAYRLARSDAVPLVVAARSLRRFDAPTLLELASICEPAFPKELHRGLAEMRPVVLLLDGLDELVGTERGGAELASTLLEKALGALPKSARVLAACRTPVFELLDGGIARALPRRPARDVYEDAISRALGAKAPRPLHLRIRPVAVAEGCRFLESAGVARELVEVAAAHPALCRFLLTPFTLRLMATALPTLREHDGMDVAELYAAYIKSCLLREEPQLTDDELNEGMLELQRATTAEAAMSDRWRAAAVGAGLLRDDGDEDLFEHQTLFEYFFARELFSQILVYDSRHLSRLNLVAGYNVNRMLVPMATRKLRSNGATDEARAVPADEYRSFPAATRWRAQTGYGIHPSMSSSRDGTPAATFAIRRSESFSVHADRRHGDEVAVAVSWYDAVAFASWKNARLPTRVEMESAPLAGDYLFWCADWYDEQASHVTGYDSAKREFCGINPDVRLGTTALAVVD